jgi:ABC-type uncharacterized transport system, permease and ATPase components
METLRAFYVLVWPFWNGLHAMRLWLLLAAALICELGFVQVSVWINHWNKSFYDALAEFDVHLVQPLLLQYIAFMIAAVILIVVGNWFGKKLSFNWRNEMTASFQKRWMQNHTHYRLRFHGEPDNPDQRIAEDISLLAEQSVMLVRNLVLNIARLSAFVAILWSISGIQTIYLGNVEMNIHGYLVWIALCYAVTATALIHLIGRDLQPLNVERQHREADYRATLLRARDHGEQIAFHRGEAAEIDRMDRRFEKIRRNWHRLIFQELKVECFSATQMRIAWFIPIVATLPLYLGKAITFGDMMQAQSAFSSVLAGFSWFLNYYSRISEWSAVVTRLAEFRKSMEDVTHLQSLATVPPHEQRQLTVRDLTVSKPCGAVLLNKVNLTIERGNWLLVEGASGTGKTTFLRALAGLWPYHSGTIAIADNVMFLPQTPYVPLDDARWTLSYPRRTPFADAELRCALAAVGLSHLSEMDEGSRDTLSGGERQRLCFARILLHKPAIVIADEPTSHLDTYASIGLLRVLKQRLPNISFIAVCHQPEVVSEFESSIVLQDRTLSARIMERRHSA